jgi:hypothetical protein
MTEPKQTEDLQALYRTAFDEWALQVGRLDRIRGSAPEEGVLEEAQRRTVAAEASYRDLRNRLTEEMGGGTYIAESQSAGGEGASPESGNFEGDRILKTKVRLERLEDRGVKEFFEMCEQFCAAAIRRGQPPPAFFARRKRLAAEEMTRRTAASLP